VPMFSSKVIRSKVRRTAAQYVGIGTHESSAAVCAVKRLLYFYPGAAIPLESMAQAPPSLPSPPFFHISFSYLFSFPVSFPAIFLESKHAYGASKLYTKLI